MPGWQKRVCKCRLQIKRRDGGRRANSNSKQWHLWVFHDKHHVCYLWLPCVTLASHWWHWTDTCYKSSRVSLGPKEPAWWRWRTNWAAPTDGSWTKNSCLDQGRIGTKSGERINRIYRRNVEIRELKWEWDLFLLSLSFPSSFFPLPIHSSIS